MATADINSAAECLKAVNALKQELENARKGLINSETSIVNRSLMLAQLQYLEEHLPDTIEKAAVIVEKEETIREETESKKKEILESASEQAQSMVNEASAKAQQMMEQANYEANNLVSRATQEANARVEAGKNEANRLVQEAEKKARQMVEEENIVRRARVECEELRENTRREAMELHQNALDVIDAMLVKTDQDLSDMLSRIRLERNEVLKHR